MSKRANILLRGLGGGSGVKPYTLAVDRAQLALKLGEFNGSTEQGLKDAMEAIKPFLSTGTEKERLDALTLFTGYQNQLTDIAAKNRRNLADKGTFESRVAEKIQSDFEDSGSGVTFRSPKTVFESATAGLDGLYNESYQEMLKRSQEGSLTDDYTKYVEDLGKMAGQYVTLQALIEDGKILPGQALEEFGFVVNADPKTGEILSTEFSTAERIRKDAGVGRVQAFVNLNEPTREGEKPPKVPVYITMTTNGDGGTEARLGNTIFKGGRGWTGRNKILTVDTDESGLIGEGDILNLNDGNLVPKRAYLERPGDYIRADFGYNEDGSKNEKMLYLGHDGKKYNVDRATAERLNMGQTTGMSSPVFAPRVPQADFQKLAVGASPYKAAEFPENTVGPTLAEPGMKPRTDMGASEQPTVESGIERISTFFGAKNRKVNVNDVAPARSGVDIIDRAKGFFRKTA